MIRAYLAFYLRRIAAWLDPGTEVEYDMLAEFAERALRAAEDEWKGRELCMDESELGGLECCLPKGHAGPHEHALHTVSDHPTRRAT